MKPRKTDYGTIILHWLLVSAVSVAFVTGLRIATEAPDRAWLNAIDFLLPRNGVWTWHIDAAVVLVGVSIAYAIYVRRSGLGRRVQLDSVRLRGLIGPKSVRLGTLSVILMWIFFGAMGTLIATGGLLYFGLFAGYDAVMVHWYAAWVVPMFALCHILIHVRIGGLAQLLRVFRPERLPPPPLRLDAVELLTLLAEKNVAAATEPQETERAPLQPQQPSPYDRHPRHQASKPTREVPKRRNATLQANAFAVAAAVAITGASAVVATDWFDVNSLRVHRIADADAPVIDGDTSDPLWRNIKPFSLMTNQGGNFDGRGETRVEIRAAHDDNWAFFLFTWEDPSRSLKQLPLIKRIDGWHLLHDGYERGDEQAFNEDKFAVLLTTSDLDLAGDRTFHASPQPIPGAPSTMTGRGLHFTGGAFVDVWQWKATSGATGWMDDDHFGPPETPNPMQVADAEPYRGGFAPDPGVANYSDNFDRPTSTAEGDPIVRPRRLPRDLAATIARMGQLSLDPDVGEGDAARWFMTQADTVPYTAEVDRLIPVGTILPGVIISGDFSGDRADVRCAARWASGHWALEVARRLDTKSKYDVPVRSGVFMRVAAFDHSQIRHTRHVRPIRLEVE